MGRIEIEIVEARNLYNSQSHGVADPYVRILIDDKNYKTKVIEKTLEPKWKEIFRFMIADEMSSQLRFEVWNNRTFSDDLLGIYTLSVGGLTKGVVKDQWYILDKSKTEAELHVRILAIDFGRTPKPDEEWMITQNIQIDPVQRAIEEGRYRPGQKTAPAPAAGPGTTTTTNTTVTTTTQSVQQQQQPQQPQYAPPAQQPYPQQPQYAPPPQQAPYPPQGYPPQQPYPQQPYPPAQQGYAPPPPQGYYPPQGYPPQGYAPPPQGYAPLPQGYPPQQPQGYYQQPPPQGYYR